MNKREPISRAANATLPDFVDRHFRRSDAEYNHRQLYRIVKQGILRTALPAGARLPTSRELARTLGIARNTIVQVYEQLALEGLVKAGVGRGTYVAELAPAFTSPPSPPRRRGTPLSRRGGGIVGGARASALQWGAFAPGVPELRLFPSAVWSRLQAQAWRAHDPLQLSYGTGMGHPALREAIAEHLKGTRGVVCCAEQILITSGAQQALHLVAQLLADPGDTVWLEDPGYWGACSVFRASGLRLQPIALDGEGLAPTPPQLEIPPRLMFVSPSHQYPGGVLMGHGRRRQLLDYAAAHRVWIVEDDYDSEFRFTSRPLPALQGLDEHGQVIYLGTFSKTMFPSLRLAYMVLPPDLIDSFARALNELFREGQGPEQVTLAQFMQQGHYVKHIRRMRQVYDERRRVLLDAIGQRLGSAVSVQGGDAGLHLVLGLPPGTQDAIIACQARTLGVLAPPLSLYSLMSQSQPGLVLGYGAVTESEIRHSFALLASVIEPHLA